MKNNIFAFSCIFSLVFIFSSCYQKSSSQETTAQTKTPRIFVTITDINGIVLSSETIVGDITNKNTVEQFAKNLAKNQGYSYMGGSWNEAGQFLGIVNTPAGKMLIAMRAADETPNQSADTTATETVQAEPEPPAPSGPFELWNGFTTDMNKKQVIEKARQSLEVTQTPLDSTKNSYSGGIRSENMNRLFTDLPNTGNYIQFTQGPLKDRILNNRVFIIGPDNSAERVSNYNSSRLKEIGYQCVEVASPMPSYLQTKYNSKQTIEENIFFYFYHDKLFAVIIYWDFSLQTKKLLDEKYGDCTAIMNSISGGKISQTWTVWKLSDRLIYSYITGGTRQQTTCYISRNYVERAMEDSERREAALKTEKEAKRKATVEGAVF